MIVSPFLLHKGSYTLRFNDELRLDLLVDARLVIELKSVENLAPVHYKQVLTYLRLCTGNVKSIV